MCYFSKFWWKGIRVETFTKCYEMWKAIYKLLTQLVIYMLEKVKSMQNSTKH